MTKQCNKCGVDLVVGENWRATAVKRSHYICNKCSNARGSAYYKANRKKRLAQVAANTSKNRPKVLAYSREWKKSNPEYDANYRKNNPGRIKAIKAKRRALMLAQTPSWYCHETVTAIYEGCPEGWHVDHIVPLAKGGLHSHENLQYLTADENRSKGASECWINW